MYYLLWFQLFYLQTLVKAVILQEFLLLFKLQSRILQFYFSTNIWSKNINLILFRPAFCILEQVPLQFVLFDRISWRILVKFRMLTNSIFFARQKQMIVELLQYSSSFIIGIPIEKAVLAWNGRWVGSGSFFGIELYSITFIQHLWTMEAIITPTSPEICWEKKRFDGPHFLWCPPPTYPSKVRESAPLFWYCTLMHSVQCKLN